jgi:ankyrin repeat protein
MRIAAGIIGVMIVAGVAAMARADWTDAHSAADTGDVAGLSKLLKRRPELVEAKEVGDHTPLHLAAWSGHADAAEVLLAHGAKIGAPDVCGWTPLHTAAVRNHINVVKLLLAKGAEVNAKDRTGQTPLRLALKYRRPDIAELLRAHGGHE